VESRAVSQNAPAPRIRPLTGSALDDVAGLLPQMTVAGSVTAGRSNIFTTLVRHPELFRTWTALLEVLLNGSLPARDRELLVLRTGWNCRSEYEWGQHVVVGRRVGLTDEEIQRVRVGASAPGWDQTTAVLLRAADELHTGTTLSEATWAALTGRYDEQQLIEIVMVVGHYHMVAMVVNSLQVERDPGIPGFDAPA
jgi:4-carboxymuconolactone decarboxylase